MCLNFHCNLTVHFTFNFCSKYSWIIVKPIYSFFTVTSTLDCIRQLNVNCTQNYSGKWDTIKNCTYLQCMSTKSKLSQLDKRLEHWFEVSWIKACQTIPRLYFQDKSSQLSFLSIILYYWDVWVDNANVGTANSRLTNSYS